jgi:gamma-glutamylcyclotransferase (GGCT)/AIG2-like uncharacterized protein YtfP
MFDDRLGNIGNFLQGIGAITLAVVGGFTAFFAVREYREKGRVEKARWLSDLFRQFFVDPTFKVIRQKIDFNDLEPIRDLIVRERAWHQLGVPETFKPEEKELLDQFTDFLNFFEFVGLLQKNGRLTDDDIGSLFHYYITRLVEVDPDNEIRRYLKELNFQNLNDLLNRVSDYLFVYGTLKSGFSHHKLLFCGGLQLVGTARVPGVLYDIPGESYPAAVFGKSGSEVEGELYRIPTDGHRTLDKIDMEEGVAEGLFARRLINVTIGEYKYPSWAYSYLQNLNDAKEVSSGVFEGRSLS